MKKLYTLYLASFFLVLSFTVNGQRISAEDTKYTYTRLPLVPLNKTFKNYQVTLVPVYEEKNEALKKEYEAAKQAAAEKYKQDLEAYPALVKAAEAAYANELAEYNKKSFGQKLLEQQVLEQNNKPVKKLPPQPYLAHVEEPKLKTSYDYKMLGSSYLNLEGYENSPGSALNITVNLYGFDYTQPRTVTKEDDRLSIGNGNASTSKAITYFTEFSYRHPLGVKVVAPDGKELLSLTPSELNVYKVYKSNPTERPQTINTELLVKTNEEKILQENLKFVNNLLNDKYGFAKVERVAKLYYIKKAGEEYNDLTTAFNEASSGLPMLQQDANTAQEKIAKAIGLWQTALKESDLNNKKARIDKDVTMALYFNLLEAYFATGQAESSKEVFDKLNTISLSANDRKIKNDFEGLFTDLKARKQNNL